MELPSHSNSGPKTSLLLTATGLVTHSSIMSGALSVTLRVAIELFGGWICMGLVSPISCVLFLQSLSNIQIYKIISKYSVWFYAQC